MKKHPRAKNQFAVNIIALAIFSTIGLFAVLTQATKPASDPITTTNLNSEYFDEYSQNFVYFYSKVILDRTSTKVVIPFKILDDNSILFAGFTPASGQPRTELLLHHPQISSLNWPTLTQGLTALYQKTPTYQTIDEFISNPPPLSTIAVDNSLHDRYPQFSTTASTNNPVDLGKIQYILTNYSPPAIQDDFFISTKILDTSTGMVNSNQELEWYIRKIDPGKLSTYLLGNIQIEFLQ